jgi:hypothetical protein
MKLKNNQLSHEALDKQYESLKNYMDTSVHLNSQYAGSHATFDQRQTQAPLESQAL